MPLRFNKEERDEWRSRMAGKSHTCAACCDGNCEDCSGTCDCSKCHGGKGASVLDALESKTAHRPDLPFEDLSAPDPAEYANAGWSDEDTEGQCPHCGGPSKFLGQLGRRTHYRCENCGMDHSSEHQSKVAGPLDEPAIHNREMFNHPKPPVIRGTLEGQGGPAASQRCPECGNPLNPDGRCSNGYCRTNEGTGQPSHLPHQPEESMRSEWSPEQVSPTPPRWGKTADASMPPAAAPYEQKPTALPYNPAAYESGVEDMHPAAQYTYQRAVAQGADPQAAYQAAQEKQGEMGKRTQEGQNVEGVQIPVINTSYHGDQAGFVSSATIKRVSHLL